MGETDQNGSEIARVIGAQRGTVRARIRLGVIVAAILLLYFVATPWFVLHYGGTTSAALAIVGGGLLNGIGAIAIWSACRDVVATARRYDSADPDAREKPIDAPQAIRHDKRTGDESGADIVLMKEMLRGLDNGELTLHYQPKYALRSSSITGVEALSRWTHPERGALRPDQFVQIAEQTGYIDALSEWALRRAIEDQREMHAAGHELSVSVNWSGRLLSDRAFTDKALAIAAGACGKLCLEVTETAIIGNPELARETLERFRAAGIAIAIDDYGTGLSSLAYLKTIPADELKIDKSFVTNMASDPTDAVLVRSAISLGHSLGLQTVAEGVESKGTLQFLYAMGCDMAQGFVIAKPMPLADLLAWLDRRSARRGSAGAARAAG